jgi:uncharacterized protein (DUF305 family)
MPASHAAPAPSSGHRAEQRQMTKHHHYARLLVMTALSFGAMYFLMYAMVERFDSYYNNMNQAYMAGLMAAAMVVIELAVMGAMYQNRTLNAAIIALSVAALVACWVLIREQGGIGDRQFLRSMIPHHSGAILMCERAGIQEPEIRELCQTIIKSQADEIAQMKSKLSALGG